jgi:hypothetical protein
LHAALLVKEQLVQGSFPPPVQDFSSSTSQLLLQDSLSWQPPPLMLYLMQQPDATFSTYDPHLLLVAHVADLLPMALDTLRLTALFCEYEHHIL